MSNGFNSTCILFSAKTIKNIVKVNEELTVDELKRLLEKERDTVRRQDRAVEALRDELERWRNGMSVRTSINILIRIFLLYRFFCTSDRVG